MMDKDEVKKLVDALEKFVPEGHGFGLIIIPESGDGRVQWVCSVDHELALASLRRLVTRMMKQGES